MAKKKVKSRFTKKLPSVKSIITDKINEEVIAAALSTVNAPVLMKVCRLCETKDGPFLNIFDSTTTTAKKIEDLMPFEVIETDDLPHKICFRCSAKVEELHEFVQRCIKTQSSLLEAIGKKNTAVTKNNIRTKWEEKLNKSNISNDDICDALIKRAMEGIKNIPLTLSTSEDDDQPLKPKKTDSDSDTSKVKKNISKEVKIDSDPEVTLKDVRLSIEKCDNRLFPGGINAPIKLGNKSNSDTNAISSNLAEVETETKRNQDFEDTARDTDASKSNQDKNEPPFNIMDYVTMIKVNRVGTLFQCKLCNRNFLKQQVVETHGCAKTGIPKIDLTVNVPLPDPPKPPSTVKYIKLDGSSKRSAKNKEKDDTSSKTADTEQSQPAIKPKPRIGPASKKKLMEANSENESQKEVSENSSKTPETNVTESTVSFSAKPSLSTLYKLIPGPNNTFRLVDGSTANKEQTEETSQKSGKKRKSSDDESKDEGDSKIKRKNSDDQDVIDLDNDAEAPSPTEQPYPVGLFQTRPQHSTDYPSTSTAEVPTFTTPAMKKQSYSIVRMANPGKLVISTKPLSLDVPKKRSKKNKTEEKANESKEPYNVTIEDITPPKDPGFFTFINVDPLLQPSYVLPTSNIIQESQISTSTPAVKNKTDAKDKYSCNLCGEKFSREKKLLTHIRSHYTQMDEEDKQREMGQKKKGKKS